MSVWQWIKYFLLVVFRPRSITRMEWQMLIYLNRDRKDFALIKLFMQDDLRDVARKHSKDMVKKDYFAHQNFKGQSPADRMKVSRVTDSISGENLAKIGGYPEPVREAQEGLMRSPGHRANILNKKYNCVGIAIHKSKDGVYYFTQNFAKRILKFTKKIYKNVSLAKGLRLKGYSLEETSGLYYHLKERGMNAVLSEGPIPVDKRGEFDYDFRFPEIGAFEVFVFTPIGGKKGKMILANHFDISVKKWWFWR